MQYSLTLNLDGFDKAESSLKSILGMLNQVKGTKSSSGSIGSSGFSGGYLNSATVAWNKAVMMASKNAQNTMNFWNAAVQHGTKSLSTIKGLPPVTGKQLAKVFGLGTFNGLSTIKGLPPVTGKQLAKVFGLGTFNGAIAASSIASQGKPPVLPASFMKQILSAPAIAGLLKMFTIVGAVTLAFDGLKLAANALKDAISDAISKGFGIYSGAGQQGLSSRFFAQRTAIAGALGVDGNPNQIFLFGNAVKELSERLSFSTNIIAANSSRLAKLHIDMSVVQMDFSALASTLATQLAPALEVTLGLLGAGINRLTVAFQSLIPLLFLLHPFEVGMAMTGVAEMMKMLGLSWKQMSQFVGSAPALTPLMKQLPASTWEHMGLVIGGGSSNPMLSQLKLQTGYLQKIAGALAPPGGVHQLKRPTGYPHRIAGALAPQGGVPRSFGLAPQTNNP